MSPGSARLTPTRLKAAEADFSRGDLDNARYWYRRAGRSYAAYPDPKAELAAIKATLTS